ncbi:MAG: DinB family protein [Lewinellaceae bacterium]|nr:DinB family protein [Lewinellaceae bacterium]
MLNHRPTDGGWSALQTIHHIIVSEELGLQYVRKKLHYSTDFQKAGWKSRWRAFQLWAYLNLPFKFKAPGVVAAEALPENSTFQATRERWLAIRQQWTHFFEEMDASLGDKAVYRHPLVGRLGWMEMQVFYREHLKRHLHQIRRAWR